MAILPRGSRYPAAPNGSVNLRTRATLIARSSAQSDCVPLVIVVIVFTSVVAIMRAFIVVRWPIHVVVCVLEIVFTLLVRFIEPLDQRGKTSS
jgi:hypothetical protein